MLRRLAVTTCIIAVAACDKKPAEREVITVTEANSTGTPIAETLKECGRLLRTADSLTAVCDQRRLFMFVSTNKPYTDEGVRVNVESATAAIRMGYETETGLEAKIQSSPIVVPQGAGGILRMPAQGGQDAFISVFAMARTDSGSSILTCSGPPSGESDCLRFVEEMSLRPETVLGSLEGHVEWGRLPKDERSETERNTDLAREGAGRTRFATILWLKRKRTDSCPTPDDLVKAKLFLPRFYRDPWNHPYVITCLPNGDVSVLSLGPDGKSGTSDDLVVNLDNAVNVPD